MTTRHKQDSQRALRRKLAARQVAERRARLEAMVEHERGDERPPGAHVAFPEVEWHPPAADTTLAMRLQASDNGADHVMPAPAEPDAPPVAAHGSVTPAVFWLLCALALASLLAKAGGWL